jgi:hypothetical protein
MYNTAYTPSRAINKSLWVISSPLYPFLSSYARKIHLASVNYIARTRKPKNKPSRCIRFCAWAECSNLKMKSPNRMENAASVMTWKINPAMAMPHHFDRPQMMQPRDHLQHLGGLRIWHRTGGRSTRNTWLENVRELVRRTQCWNMVSYGVSQLSASTFLIYLWPSIT